MHDSFTPLGVVLSAVQYLARLHFAGGVGAGLYGFLVLAVIAVFVAGLMVGRTPEYLGKKIETREMKLAMLAILIYPLTVLGFTSGVADAEDRSRQPRNTGPHGLTEVLYAFASTNANNGSAFAGLTAIRSGSTRRWVSPCSSGASSMSCRYCLGRLLRRQKKAAASVGTFPTHGPLFVGLLLGVIVILYLLQYFPALALGPIVEHFLMHAGKTF